ncbi:MAG: hypothetical protein RRY15_02360 [Bacteroidales bacterium]
MRSKLKVIARYVCICVGLLFLFSAGTKLYSIDSFEIYIFSLNFAGLDVSFLLARLLIAFELLLGLSLCVPLFQRSACWVAFVSLIGFSVFLLWQMFIPHSEHCHCFGDWIQLSHKASLIKNLFLLSLILAVLWCQEHIKTKPRRRSYFLLLGFALFSLALPFILSPPDSFYYEQYAQKNDYNSNLLDSFLKTEHLDTTSCILCFYGPTCPFCQLAAKKIEVIAHKNPDKFAVNFVFFGSKPQIKLFFQKNHLVEKPYLSLSPSSFLKITQGNMPLIFLIRKGKVIHVFGYRDIREKQIIQFYEH